eukprot:1161898-Pelagomonas_calceolata.AAC.8
MHAARGTPGRTSMPQRTHPDMCACCRGYNWTCMHAAKDTPRRACMSQGALQVIHGRGTARGTQGAALLLWSTCAAVCLYTRHHVSFPAISFPPLQKA